MLINKTHKKNAHSFRRNDFSPLAFFIFLFLISQVTLKAQPTSFVKGIYVSVTAEPNFVLYGTTSVSTLDCVDSMCKLSYVDGICYKILWKDLTVDSSNGILSITLYKQNLNQLLEAAISQKKAVAIALYAGAFTPPVVISSMPANHVLSNIHLAAQSGGPCKIDSIVTPHNSPGTYNVPAPWDTVYQANFRNIMRILNNYLVQNGISLSYIVFTGINEYSGETRLPNDIIQTRDSSGNVNFFQNDFVLWRNAGFDGYTVNPKINEARSTFDLFLDSIYNKYPAFQNAVLCVQSMGGTTEFPRIPNRLPKTAFDDPKSVKYYACATNFDSTSDVFYDMFQDAMRSNRQKYSVASMFCSLDEIYAATGVDYVHMVISDTGNNTGLCSSFKAYHLRDIEFLTAPTAPSTVDSVFVSDLQLALSKGVSAGAQLIEVFPYDVFASQQATNNKFRNELRRTLNLTHHQLRTIAPDYNGIPVHTTISADTLGIQDTVVFSIPELPAVNSYTWFVDGVSEESGDSLLNFKLQKTVVAVGAHTVTVNYSTNCGTNSASLKYSNGIPSILRTPIFADSSDFTVRQIAPRNFIISFSSPVENAHILVFNIAGQQVLNATCSGSQFNFNLYSVAAGLYLLKVQAPENQINSTVKISVAQ